MHCWVAVGDLYVLDGQSVEQAVAQVAEHSPDAHGVWALAPKPAT